LALIVTFRRKNNDTIVNNQILKCLHYDMRTKQHNFSNIVIVVIFCFRPGVIDEITKGLTLQPMQEAELFDRKTGFFAPKPQILHHFFEIFEIYEIFK